MKEKRRRAVHLIKEGLDDPLGDDLSKKEDLLCRTESETEEDHLAQVQEYEENDTIQPMRTERKVLNAESVPFESSEEPVHGNELVNYKSVAKPLAAISTDKQPDEIKSVSPMSCSNDEIKSPKSKV